MAEVAIVLHTWEAERAYQAAISRGHPPSEAVRLAAGLPAVEEAPPAVAAAHIERARDSLRRPARR